jgi:multiple sugar transport system permease protein
MTPARVRKALLDTACNSPAANSTTAAESMPCKSTPPSPRSDRTGPWARARRLGSDNTKVLFIAPTLLAVLAINGYPIVYSVILSFQNEALSNPHVQFVGLENYIQLLGEASTWQSILLSFEFTACSVALSYVVGLAAALLLNRPIPGRGIMRSMLIIPWAVPVYVAALTWAWMFNDQFGIIDAILAHLGVTNPPVWLGTEWAMPSLILVMFWKSFPFMVVMILAALQSEPPELIEAAKVDGANWLSRFRYITFPWIAPISMLAVLLATVNAFQFFPIPWILTQGGPDGATNVISISSYDLAFQAGEVSQGATIAVIMFLIVLVFAVVYALTLVRREIRP